MVVVVVVPARLLQCMSSCGNRLQEAQLFSRALPSLGLLFFPHHCRKCPVSVMEGGQSLEGVGLGIWIQVLALCMSIVINSLVIFCVCMHAKSLQSCLTLFDPMDCSLPGSSVHEILQARMLEWVAISFSRGSS